MSDVMADWQHSTTRLWCYIVAFPVTATWSNVQQTYCLYVVDAGLHIGNQCNCMNERWYVVVRRPITNLTAAAVVLLSHENETSQPASSALQ